MLPTLAAATRAAPTVRGAQHTSSALLDRQQERAGAEREKREAEKVGKVLPPPREFLINPINFVHLHSPLKSTW